MGADAQENRIQTGYVVQLFDCSQTLTTVSVYLSETEAERERIVCFNMRLIHTLWKCFHLCLRLIQIRKFVCFQGFIGTCVELSFYTCMFVHVSFLVMETRDIL